MSELSQLKCTTPRANEPTLAEAEINRLHPQIPEWQIQAVNGEKRLERVFKFKNFAQALEFTNKIGGIAEQQDHHPLIVTEWGKVTVQWWTHVVKGLHKNDFIMAAKTDELWSLLFRLAA
ncbi:MAG TPA: 4a-hydroxytetrahydrobiopterin dehydratase [Anaerolineales bacterium]|nr:4a-hydroxytetrahydrobiopterin dehydratase [Anaerolineales bacterium]